MVQEDDSLWFADEGSLSRTLCELVTPSAPEDADEEGRECCACDDAKYKVRPGPGSRPQATPRARPGVNS